MHLPSDTCALRYVCPQMRMPWKCMCLPSDACAIRMGVQMSASNRLAQANMYPCCTCMSDYRWAPACACLTSQSPQRDASWCCCMMTTRCVVWDSIRRAVAGGRASELCWPHVGSCNDFRAWCAPPE
eukprot:scaffold11864_cov24-Tisochrysis_lutea.AAC.1